MENLFSLAKELSKIQPGDFKNTYKTPDENEEEIECKHWKPNAACFYSPVHRCNQYNCGCIFKP